MKIRSLDGKYNIIPRVFSMFPFFGSVTALSIWNSNDSLFALLVSLFFACIFCYTFFFTRYEKYIDTDAREIIKNFKWLWINLSEHESLEQYDSVCICLGPLMANSNWQSRTKSHTFDVALIRKYTKTTSLLGLGGFENYPLKVAFRDVHEAKEYGVNIDKLLNVGITVDDALTQFLQYDLLE